MVAVANVDTINVELVTLFRLSSGRNIAKERW